MNSDFEKFFNATPPPRPDKSKSLFEEEALRIAALNKNKKNSGEDWLVTLFASGAAGIFVFILYMCLTAYSIFAHGFVGMHLWNWFVVGHIPGAPLMTTCNAAGIALILRLFTYENPFSTQEGMNEVSTSEKAGRFFLLLIIPWMSLLVGYILHRLM